VPYFRARDTITLRAISCIWLNSHGFCRKAAIRYDVTS
jgi:hypothetical protein